MKYHGRRARHRRRRKARFHRAVRGFCLLTLVVFCAIATHWLGERARTFASADYFAKAPSLADLSSFRTPSIQVHSQRVVYPYSVVPGGVHSARELRTATEDDPVVGIHYAGFDYRHARLVEVRQPRLVYLSYRKDDHIYWTRKQLSLHVGEKLLTDGHITARTRCGNQVAVLPQSETSPHEPTMAELDRPDALASGTEQPFPSEIASSLLQVDPGLPLHSLTGNAFAGGPPPGGFMPMPIGFGGGVGTPIAGVCPPNKISNSKTCKHNPPPPPPPVPEPETMVLMASGLAILIERYRRARP